MTRPHFSAGTENVVSSPKPFPNRIRPSNMPSTLRPARGHTELPTPTLPCLCYANHNQHTPQSYTTQHSMMHTAHSIHVLCAVCILYAVHYATHTPANSQQSYIYTVLTKKVVHLCLNM